MKFSIVTSNLDSSISNLDSSISLRFLECSLININIHYTQFCIKTHRKTKQEIVGFNKITFFNRLHSETVCFHRAEIGKTQHIASSG